MPIYRSVFAAFPPLTKLKVGPYNPKTHSTQTTSHQPHPATLRHPALGVPASSQISQHQTEPPLEAQRGPCAQLTILAVVEHDELLPAQLCHQPEHDVVEAHWRSGGQCVGLAIRAGVQVAGGTWRPSWVALDKEVGDVHGVCEGLQGIGGCTASGCDQGQNPLGHEVTGWKERGGRGGGQCGDEALGLCPTAHARGPKKCCLSPGTENPSWVRPAVLTCTVSPMFLGILPAGCFLHPFNR